MVITRSTFSNNGSDDGGGLYNNGDTVTIADSFFIGNESDFGGGGLVTDDGTVTIERTTFSDNSSNGGGGLLLSGGTVTVTDSTFVDNNGLVGPGGGLSNGGGLLKITNSTVAHNQTRYTAGGLANFGTTIILNSTIADNQLSGPFDSSGVGIFTFGGSVTSQNTILARNTLQPPFTGSPDCSGTVASLGNNLIGDPTGCTIILQNTDLTGDPGLDTFTDDGTPGNGHFPLLPTSQAIDAGNDAACPKWDQLGEKRHHPCDIGSIEFTGKP